MKNNAGDEIARRLAAAGKEMSIYVHLPFCAGKCPYCSFVSMVPKYGEIEEYCKLLRSEIRFFGDRLAGTRLSAKTLYFGGGTPTLLPPAEWRRLLDCIRENIALAEQIEISVEANPESLTEEHVRLWKEETVARISIGVQSLSDEELRWLGRLHDAARARAALSMCVGYGFSVSADLMFGLAGQSIRSFSRSVKDALSLGAEHLSLYQLAIDEKSRWFVAPPEGRSYGYPFYRWSQWYLPRKGFVQYEISSFALPGKECRHNSSYWTNDPVLALGAGAWGYAEGVRYCNERTLESYGKTVRRSGHAVAEMETHDTAKRAREAAILLLRTSCGILFEPFSSRYGEDALSAILRILEENAPSDCFVRNAFSLALSPKGMRVANALWSLIV
mgnify:CR=1 FL=1